MSTDPHDTPADSAALRVLDASLNRATEGLRVVEDYVRFVLDDASLTERAKQLRHRLADVGEHVPWRHRVATRAVTADVGTEITTPSEGQRASALEVCVASLERAQQALRSVEEFGKAIDARIGAAVEQIRYGVYDLAAAIAAQSRGADRLRDAQLYALVSASTRSEAEFTRLVTGICGAGVDVVQLRDKRLGDRELLRSARVLVDAAHAKGAVAIVNDRPDIARLAGADGVHVGQEELTVADVRRIVGPDALVGVSTHSPDQLRQAITDGANYLGLGPTFPSSTKTFDAFPGTDYLAKAAKTTALPAFAIGGINAGNLPQVLATGIDCVAVSSAIEAADDPVAAAAELRRALDTPTDP